MIHPVVVPDPDKPFTVIITLNEKGDRKSQYHQFAHMGEVLHHVAETFQSHDVREVRITYSN